MARRDASPVARDLNDLFRDGELDLDSVEDAGVPRLPLADAEDLWLAECARRPAHLEVTKISERHLGINGKLLLAAIVALHRAGLPVDGETMAGEVATAAAAAAWASWKQRGDQPKMEVRTLPKRMRVDSDGNLAYAEDVLIRAYGESKYADALARAAVIQRERGMAASMEFLRGVEARIEAACTGVRWKRAGEVGRALVSEFVEKLRAGDTGFISSDFARLDAFTRGWRPRRMTSIGGWPGHGKSTLLIQALVSMAVAGRRDVAYISLEDEATIPITRLIVHLMADEGAARRLASLTPKTSSPDGFHETDIHALERFVRQHLEALGLHICDDGPWSREKVRAAIISAGRSGCRVVGVDYLQALPDPSGSDNPTAFYNACVASWKDAAKSVNVHLILGTQLRRAKVEARGGKEPWPKKDDSFYCPAIEQASEYMILCHRYEKDDEAQGRGQAKPEEAARLILAKGKDSGPGVIPCRWSNERQLFILA